MTTKGILVAWSNTLVIPWERKEDKTFERKRDEDSKANEWKATGNEDGSMKQKWMYWLFYIVYRWSKSTEKEENNKI